ncbi:extensin [Streptomyces sp. NPDC059900]|uniref:extensin n=1 Tax=Streptomyces sp. NPDC059900 TaxID=3155816 RepID=UPI00341F87BD
MTPPTPAQAQALLTALTRSLAGVAVLTLAFTAVNVTLFATSRGVSLGIAILLDPMVALALATVLYADARLAAWGLSPPAWSAALRWFTATAATLMNTWTSIWPDRQIGWPTHADPAGILLHGVPTVLLILLTETIAAYRRTITPLLSPTDDTDHTTNPDRAAPNPDAPAQPPQPLCYAPAFAPRGAVGHDGRRGPAAPAWYTDTPVAAPAAPTHVGGPIGAADGDTWARAIAIDESARATTGSPASIWRLRTDLHVGPDRARQIRAQLLTRCLDGTPPLS